MARAVKPSSPTLSFDASNIGELPEELRDAMRAFISEKEEAEARAKREEDRAYQNGQAQSLEASGRWFAVRRGRMLRDVVDPEAPELYEWSLTHELASASDSVLGYPLDEHDYWYEQDLSPSLHTFYHDLYGISFLSPDRSQDYRFFHAAEWHTKEFEGIDAPILVNHRDRQHPYQLYHDYFEYLRAVQRETSYIYLGSFWQPPNGFLTAKRNAMLTIGGFCVDIDRFESPLDDSYCQRELVISTLLDTFAEHPEIEPNYIMLSGTGIQLWYVFGEQIPLLSRKSPRREKYGKLLKLLYKWFDDNLPKNRFKVDVPCATISHAFRAPGSPSKGHYPTLLFIRDDYNRPMISPLDLSDFLGGDLRPYDLEDWDQEAYQRERAAIQPDKWKSEPATQKQLSYLSKLEKWGCIEVPDGALTQGEADELIKRAEIVATNRLQYKQTNGAIKTAEGHVVPRRKRAPGVYYYTLERIGKDTPAGSRYNALFGLAGLAWNCGIPKSQLESDLRSFLGTEWAKRLGHDGLPLTEDDIKAAAKGWHQLGALRTREQLEFRLQWKYGPPAKRNNRKQSMHLQELARPMIDTYRRLGEKEHLPGRPKKADLIRAYFAEHPDASHSEIARDLGVSRPTVIKWLKDLES